MKKLFVIKEHPFVFIVALIILLTIFLLIIFRPSHPHRSDFVNEENVEQSLPDYKVREIDSGEWNKGVCVESINGDAVVGNTLLIPASDTVVMYGWAVDIDRKCPASEIYMEVNGKFVKGVYGLPRMDIQKQVAVKCSPNVGFYFYFDRRLLGNEPELATDVKFHLIDKEQMMVISAVDFSLMYQSSISEKPTRIVETGGWFSGMVLDYCGGGTIQYGATRQVESMTKENLIRMIGWAVDLDHRSPLKSLYLSVNDVVYKIGYGTTSRIDVKEAIGIEGSDRLGFDITLPRIFFQNADGTLCDHIDFYLEDKNGYISGPIRYDWVNN